MSRSPPYQLRCSIWVPGIHKPKWYFTLYLRGWQISYYSTIGFGVLKRYAKQTCVFKNWTKRDGARAVASNNNFSHANSQDHKATQHSSYYPSVGNLLTNGRLAQLQSLVKWRNDMTICSCAHTFHSSFTWCLFSCDRTGFWSFKWNLQVTVGTAPQTWVPEVLSGVGSPTTRHR